MKQVYWQVGETHNLTLGWNVLNIISLSEQLSQHHDVISVNACDCSPTHLHMDGKDYVYERSYTLHDFFLSLMCIHLFNSSLKLTILGCVIAKFMTCC